VKTEQMVNTGASITHPLGRNWTRTSERSVPVQNTSARLTCPSLCALTVGSLCARNTLTASFPATWRVGGRLACAICSQPPWLSAGLAWGLSIGGFPCPRGPCLCPSPSWAALLLEHSTCIL
jgi:hypothetical protein